MAKLTAKQWGKVRQDYEVCNLTMGQLSKAYNVAKSSISRHAKSEEWTKTAMQHLIGEKVSLAMQSKKIDQETERLSTSDRVALNKEAERRVILLSFFEDAALYNQEEATKMLTKLIKGESVELQHFNTHSQITARNKETVLGKAVQTEINIENNTGTCAGEVIRKLIEKHKDS